MITRSARPCGAGGEAATGSAEFVTVELWLAGSPSGRGLLPKRAMFPLNEDSLQTEGTACSYPNRAVFPMLEHPLCSDKVACAGHGRQPMRQPRLALTAPEFGLTIKQDVLTASKALAGMPLSSETRASGHCGNAAPSKNQLLPLSASIRP